MYWSYQGGTYFTYLLYPAYSSLSNNLNRIKDAALFTQGSCTDGLNDLHLVGLHFSYNQNLANVLCGKCLKPTAISACLQQCFSLGLKFTSVANLACREVQHTIDLWESLTSLHIQPLSKAQSWNNHDENRSKRVH